MQIDNFTFNTKDIAALLVEQTEVLYEEETKVGEEKTTEEIITFKQNVRSRGAPKKEKRLESITEKKKANKEATNQEEGRKRGWIE